MDIKSYDIRPLLQGNLPARNLREALDTVGLATQVSALTLIVLLSLIRQISPSSPSTRNVSTRTKIFGEPWTALALISISLLSLGYLGVVYVPGLPGTNVNEVSNNYIFYTRLPVQILAALLPFHILLSNSSPLNLLPWLLKTARTTLVPYHRTLGWSFMLLFALHGSMYMNFYLDKGILLKRIQDSDVQLGMALSSTFSAVAFASRKSFRASIGRNWVWAHISAASLITVLLWFHVKQTRIYVLQTIVIGLIGVGWRASRLLVGGSSTVRKEIKQKGN